MISFRRTLFQFFANILDFYSREYILEDNKFIRERKMNFYDHINYILVQKGCTSYIEALELLIQAAVFCVHGKKILKTIQMF